MCFTEVNELSRSGNSDTGPLSPWIPNDAPIVYPSLKPLQVPEGPSTLPLPKKYPGPEWPKDQLR